MRRSTLRRSTLRLGRWIVAVAAVVALSFSLSLHLTGTSAPWARLGDLVRTAPTPAEAAVRKKLSELAIRTNVASVNAEDLAAATAFYNARRGPLLWITERGLSERGNSVIEEIRRADDWGLRARDFALPRLPAGAVSPEAAAAAEISVTLAVLKYARHARGGRLGDHGAEQAEVRAREDREADPVHVLLDGGLRHHGRRLVEPRVDDLDTRVAQRARDHLGATVVAVETGLGDQDAQRAAQSHAGSR